MGANTFTARKDIEHYRKKLGLIVSDAALVDDLTEWKNEYLRLQDAVDMILWGTPVGIKGWDDDLAEAFILKNTKVPSAGTSDHYARYATIGRVKSAEEQGWWTGKTALRILDGTPPADIPVTTNKELKILLNMQLAKRLGITFPMELLEKATFIEEITK
ncbi:MAG: hypothetical protein GY801_08485 [bacterium]|nr:hypothetical protein [bacterium]